ncbi:Hsp70 family protein [Microbacterium sp.]|uniref:Hsp70 family protein n=1 Tax=Microbacterium sp. TaxID=51671 RepID=UPI002BC0598B|nr:Hsp70 family protein [Microbacterium sp.]HWK76633.1 Hsp70 family protein [Microbacterium sp.]
MGESEFVLALDLGNSRIIAASAGLAQSEEIDADSKVLGHRSGPLAALAYVTPEGDLLFGDVAEQRGFTHPENLIRSFIGDVGDDVPLVAGTRSITAAELTAALISWAAGLAERHNARPPVLAIAHPSSWSAHRIDALRTALGDAGLEDAHLVTSAAAALHHHERMLRDMDAPALATGSITAVYDLGGETFEATVLRKDGAAEYRIIGEPVALPDAGGALFDDLVLEHAIRMSAGADGSSIPDAGDRVALARLRRACVSAKESLSFDSDAAIPVTLAGRSASVRITRSELDTMIDSTLDRTVEALERALDDAQVRSDQVDHILLIGGSSHVPLVAQRLSERFDRPLVSAPDGAAAFGAAVLVLEELGAERRSVAALPTETAAEQPSIDIQADAAPRPRRRRLIPIFGPASVRTATPAVVTIAAVVVAAGVATSTAGAAILRGTADDAPATTSTAALTDLGVLDPFAPLFSPVEGPAPADQVAPVDVEPAPIITPKPAEPSGPRNVVRDTLPSAEKKRPQAPEQSRRGPVIENAATPPSSPPSSTPVRTPSPNPAPSVAPTPSDPPPSDPPTDPPVDPTPSDPPIDPPPSDPTPSDPPTDPPVDPTPSDPPTEPPVDPTPTAAPADPVPTPPADGPTPSAPSADPT